MPDPTEQKPEVEEVEENNATDFASANQPKDVFTTDVELKKLQHEMMEYKDKYLRLLADQENIRKRQQKEKLDQLRYANEGLMIDFLRPIDNLENALNFAKEMSDEVKNWAVGFQMILTQFKDVLSANGVTVFDSKGTPFDPHSHEAVEMVDSDEYPSGYVIEEFIRGYKMGDRIIRPARVKVCKTREDNNEDLTNEENQ